MPYLRSMIVFAKIIDGLAQALDRVIGTAAGIGLHAFASAPQNKNLRAQFRSNVHGAHGFLNRVRANFGIVGGESSVAKDGMEEEMRLSPWEQQCRWLAGLLETQRTMQSRSAGVASMGTRSLSCRLTPQAPTSASIETISIGEICGRTKSPKGSRPRLPTVHKPKGKLMFRTRLVVVRISMMIVMNVVSISQHYQLIQNGFHRGIHAPVHAHILFP